MPSAASALHPLVFLVRSPNVSAASSKRKLKHKEVWALIRGQTTWSKSNDTNKWNWSAKKRESDNNTATSSWSRTKSITMAIEVTVGRRIAIITMNICYVPYSEKTNRITLAIMACIRRSRHLLVDMGGVNLATGGNLPKLVRVKSRKAKFTTNWAIHLRTVK